MRLDPLLTLLRLRVSDDGPHYVLPADHRLDPAHQDTARVVATGSPAEAPRADLLETAFDIPKPVNWHPQLAHPFGVAEPHEG